MKTGSNFFSTTAGVVCTGLVLGALAILLQRMGNPGNMGICVACFNRDIAGAIGLHRAAIVQYLRPEILGMVLGALCASLLFGEYRARGGSSPIIRLLLGMVAAIGAPLLIWVVLWAPPLVMNLMLAALSAIAAWELVRCVSSYKAWRAPAGLLAFLVEGHVLGREDPVITMPVLLTLLALVCFAVAVFMAGLGIWLE